MIYFRVIPVLLIDGEGCFKTIKFNKKIYLGDPINIIKIFNDLEVDEIIILDISPGNNVNYNLLQKLSQESFVPLTYGGKIKNEEDVENVIKLGFEKISINSLYIENPGIVKKIIKKFGSSTISMCVNIKTNIFGKNKVHYLRKRKNLSNDIIQYLKAIQDIKPGEIFITFMDNEGTQSGFDIEVLKEIKKNISCNLIVNGGLRDSKEILDVKNLNFSGVAGSRFFCFKNGLDSILINYIDQAIKNKIYENFDIRS